MLLVFTTLVAGLLAGEATGAPTATTFFRNATTTGTAIPLTPSLEPVPPPGAGGEPQINTCTSVFMYDYQALEEAVVELCRSGSPTHRFYLNPYGYTPTMGATMNACWSSWDTKSAEYFATAPITTGTFGTLSSAVYYQQPWDFVASPPCCSSCSLFGGTVQVYFWPTPASSPPVSILTNADNFTFISPSIYVAFESLYATDLCGDVGKAIPRTTIAFDETAVSTSLDFQWNTEAYYPFTVRTPDAFTQAHFGDQSNCENITSTWYNGAISGVENTIPTLTRGTAIPYTYNLCSPAVSVPSQLFSLNPLWPACVQGISAFFDPPYTLTTGNGLKPFSTPTVNDPAEPSPKAGDPAPGAVPNPGGAKPTDPPSVPNDPPSQQPPPNNDPSPQDPPSNDPPPPPTNNDPTALIVALGTSIITANSASVFIVDTQTLSPGGPPITIAETGYSITNNGAVFTSTPDPPTLSSSTRSTITTLVQVVIGSVTLKAGGPDIMVGGTVLSLDPSGSSIVIGGSTTENLKWYLTAQSSATALSQPHIVVGTQTLAAGGSEITLSGTIVSLDSGGSSVIVGASTVAMSVFLGAQTPTTTSSAGLGGVIASIGGFATPMPTPSPSLTSMSTELSNTVSTKPISVLIMNNPTNSMPAHSISTIAGPAPSGSMKCGAGLLICQVEDPTRLEIPWHGVSAAFPQCYDPTAYECVENFLCPINAPKVKGEYACGPVVT